jgi:hypothetical protein
MGDVDVVLTEPVMPGAMEVAEGANSRANNKSALGSLCVATRRKITSRESRARLLAP